MDRYRFEMDRLEPRQEKLDELYDMIEGGTEVKQAKWIGRKAAALILAAAVLTITAAAAAVPAVWEAMTKQLGAFAPYAQTIRGAVCRDQGIKVQVLSALADDLEARFYISVQDVEQDRLKPIAGLMPDPSALPVGCSFAPRCPYRTAACEAAPVGSTQLSPTHCVRCVRAGELAGGKEGGQA